MPSLLSSSTSHRGASPGPRMNNPLSFGTVLGTLEVVEKSITGVGVPGLEAAVGGTLMILQMIETMQNNKKDLADLCDKLGELKTELDKASSSAPGGELAPRLSHTSIQLATIIVDCNALKKSHRAKRFFQGTRIATQIADIRQSVRDVIQNFVFFGSISIEKIVGDMAPRLGKLIVSTHISKLMRAPARYDADDTPSECMKGTRVDLIDDLMKNAADASPSSRITMVYGIPGSGKSTIAKTVAIQLAQRGLLAASFFFSRNHVTRRELKLVFSTIAFQLAQYNKDYGHRLSDLLENDPDLVHEGAKDHLDKLIIHPLSQLPPPTDGKLWIIMLDALDECGVDHGGSLLQLLTSRLAQFPDHVRFFLTGRPEGPVLSAFDITTIKPITYKHTLDTAPDGAISKDIRLYVSQSLGGEWYGKGKWKAKDSDLDVLVTRAGGLFIFAATAVKYIQGRVDRYNPQKSLESIIHGVGASGPKPGLLDQLYYKVIDDAVPAEDITFLANYRRVLGAVIYLQEPLSAAAIAELLGMDDDDVSRIIKLLNSVLSVSEETVRIAHLSFREFITSPPNPNLKYPPAGSLPSSSTSGSSLEPPRADLFLKGPTHHSELATRSIHLMNKMLHRNACELDIPDTYAPNSDVPNLAKLVTKNIPPELRYACFYWASHFQTADNVEPSELETWLGTSVLSWLEALSLCGELSRAVPLVMAAQSWYHHNPTRTDFTRYTTLLSDTKRFITASFNTISLSAGHIYHSALPFTPTSSELSQTYGNLVESSVRVVTGVDPKWSPLQWTVHGRGQVYGVAFSPSGECIASTCVEAIEVRSSSTGRLLSTLEGHTDDVQAVAFSRDGTRIVSGSRDNTIRIWSLETDQSFLILEGHADWVYAVAFSPDDARIVSGSRDNTIRIWSSETGALLSILEGHSDWVRSITFSPDGARVVSGSDDRTVQIWSSETSQSLLTLGGHTGGVHAVAISSDGTRIVSSSGDQTVRIWSSETGQSLFTLEGHTNWVRAVAFSGDGTRIVSGSGDSTIRIWSSETGQSLFTLNGHTSWVYAVAFSRDGTRIVSGARDNTTRFWSSEIDQSPFIPGGHTDGVIAIAFSRDGTRVVSGSSDHMIRIWSSETGQSLLTLKGHSNWVRGVAFSRDGTRIASDSSDDTVRIWSSETGELLLTLEGYMGWLHAIAFSPDKTRLVSGTADTMVRIWSSETGALLSTLEGHTGGVNAVAFSPDGAHIVSGSFDQTVRIWSSETSQLLLTLEGHANWVFTVAFSPDSTRIVSGSSDDTVRIWSSETGQTLLTLKGHIGGVHAVTFSPDGTCIVSGSGDQTIRSWSSETGELLSTLKGHYNTVEAVASSLGVGPSTPTPDHFVIEPAKGMSEPWDPIQFDQGTGWITLSSSAKPVCILPADYASSIETSNQSGSVLAFGHSNHKVLILDFSRVSLP